jgi:ABC-type dipeptide/oligopeptide/nickel transport system permease component
VTITNDTRVRGDLPGPARSHVPHRLARAARPPSWSGAAARRVGHGVMTLLGASIAVWLLFALAPGDPAERALAARGILAPSPHQLQQMSRQLGTDQPWFAQYLHWLGGILHGDFGISYMTQAPVITEVGSRLLPTLRLALVALVMTALLALFLGMLGAAFANRWPDLAVRSVIVVCATTPAFISGLLIMQFVIVRLHIGHALANGGWSDAILPGLCLALAAVAVPARVLRGELVEATQCQYSLLATARGARKSYVLVRHGLPNAVVPFVHAMALTAAWLIGGAVVVEAVFNWPGIGSYLVTEVENHDLPVVQAITLLATASFVIASMGADLVTTVIDSRKGGRS